jgi:hypothetical protein
MKRALIEKTLRYINETYSSTQRDGFGFSLQCGERRYTERYCMPNSYSGIGRLRDTLKDIDPFFSDGYKDTHETPDWKMGTSTGPLIAHGRTSTGSVEIANTHPFTKNRWTLAHNGVVGWRGEVRKLETTCDSEHLLNCYAMGNGVEDLKDLSGWAAWVAISPENRLVAGRDSITPLHFAFSKQLSAYIIATKKEDLERYADVMKIKCGRALLMRANSEVTFDTHGVDVEGVIHGGLSTFVEASMYASAGKALGCDVGKATKGQVLGYCQPSFGSWMDESPASAKEIDEDVAAVIKEWEKGNFHEQS